MGNNKLSKEEKVAKITSKYGLYGVLITVIGLTIGYFVNRNNAKPVILPLNIKDTTGIIMEIKNNTVDQSNSSNSNAQIGTNNTSK